MSPPSILFARLDAVRDLTRKGLLTGVEASVLTQLVLRQGNNGWSPALVRRLGFRRPLGRDKRWNRSTAQEEAEWMNHPVVTPARPRWGREAAADHSAATARGRAASGPRVGAAWKGGRLTSTSALRAATSIPYC